MEQAGIPKTSELWEQVKAQGEKLWEEAMAAKPLPDRVRSAYDWKAYAGEVVKAIEERENLFQAIGRVTNAPPKMPFIDHIAM